MFGSIDPVAFGKEMGKLMREEMDKRLAPVLARLEAMEQKGISYRGNFNISDEYKRGDIVTFSGSAFHCVRDVHGEYPHRVENGARKASQAWQLMVKRGDDADKRSPR